MNPLETLLSGNRAWANDTRTADPKFFERLASGQSPHYFWIGCSDSRVPATQICGMDPGSVFVHRNVANLVTLTDHNCIAALQYAVDVLKVNDIIVCGHRDCGGVRAALEGGVAGVAEEWLGPLRAIADRHAEELEPLTPVQRTVQLCEWSVARQVLNLSVLPVVREAWKRGQALRVHGLVYSVADGILNDLGVSIEDAASAAALEQRVP